MPNIETKPQETVEWILECVSDNLLFLKLDRDQKERVVQRMELKQCKKGKPLIQQVCSCHAFLTLLYPQRYTIFRERAMLKHSMSARVDRLIFW